MIKKLYILLIVSFVSQLYGNVPELANQINTLQTDRLCYVSGDLIFLKAFLMQSDVVSANETVLYIDIADRDSQFIAGQIFKLDEGMASGFIQIPDTVKTGYFFVRAYTYNSIISSKQMILSSRKVFITNRFGNNSERFDDSINSDEDVKNSSFSDLKPNEDCEINLNDTLFKRRSKVLASIQLNDDFVLDTLWGVITVKPISQCESQMELANDQLSKNGNRVVDAISQTSIISEEKGMIISGLVTHSITGNPLSNILVMLAFEDSVIRLKYSITDKSGVFKILLTDCYDNQTVYLSAYSYPNLKNYTQANITVDSKFLVKKSAQIENKNGVGYESSTDSINILKSIIAKAYGISYVETEQNTNQRAPSFEQLYMVGNLSNTVNIDDYIDLPDFIEITREILPLARLRKNDNKYTFSAIDCNSNIIRENPVVFVDGVPLTDINTILTWGTSKIKSVQVQAEPRYFGDAAFENGMILIWTKKMDFWSKVENKNTYIFNIPCFQKPIKFNFPDYSKQTDNFQPDFRQLLYWEPSVIINSKEPFNLEFYTSDELGTFEVLLQGVTSSKKPLLIRKYIQVK